MPSIWALLDDKPGHAAQALGVAEKLGLPFEEKRLSFTFLSRLSNRLVAASLLGVHAQASGLTPPWPDLVIAAGRRTAPVAAFIKKRHPATRTIQLMRPDMNPRWFDLIALPEHDGVRAGDTVLTTLLSPHRLTEAKLAEAARRWHSAFAHLPTPRIALLAGGNAKESRFLPEDFTRLAGGAARLAKGGSLLMTTSRRTGAEGEAAIAAALKASGVPHYAYDWRSGAENPYLGLLACADAIVVTGDSMSMCAEACFTGKPVFIFAPSVLGMKHARLHRRLYEKGWAVPLDERAAYAPHTPLTRDPQLDAAQIIADAIQAWFL